MKKTYITPKVKITEIYDDLCQMAVNSGTILDSDNVVGAKGGSQYYFDDDLEDDISDY